MKMSEIKVGKCNVLDLSILFVLIVFLGVMLYGRIQATNENLASESTTSSTSFTYTIEIKNLASTSAEVLREGDEVYERTSNTMIGKISHLEITQAQGLLEKTNGEIITSPLPNRIDVKMTIQTDGTIRNGEYLANGLIRILVGNFKEIKTKYLMCAGTIISLDKVAE